MMPGALSRTTHRLLVGIVLLALGAPLYAQPTIIRAGRLVDPVSGVALRDRFVVVENGRITSVGATPPILKDARSIDLSGLTVMPGLIDAHVHLVIGGPVRDNALATLRAGFTTVVDLGARTTQILTIRDSINAGQIDGPRVLAAGVWVGTKNGVCEFNGIGLEGTEAFRSRVRENVEAGADVIKVCVSGWPAAAHARPEEYEIDELALRAVVREAHESNRLVLAHDISLGGVRAGLLAGIDGLAHAAYLDSAMAIAVRERGAFIVPTLASLTAADSSAVARDLIAAMRLAHRMRVPFVFGTDGGVLPHGQKIEEFRALRALGLSPIDAIRAATINAARAFRMADSVGTIAPGMHADLIAVEGDPLQNIEALGRVRFVMARGRVVVQP
jgi:imidazolonepropionase-like amidohydrolase